MHVLTLKIDEETLDMGEKPDWEHYSFEEVPLIACLTILKALQSDVRNAQATMYNHFINQIGKMDIKFDAFEAKVIPTTGNYVLKGEKFEAEIFLSAFSSTASNYKIFVGGTEYPVNGGKAIYNGGTGAIGEKGFSGKIVVANPETGEETEYPFEQKYFVGQSNVSISADAMRVFYMGVDNPLSISVSGFDDKDVRASLTGGTMTKTGAGKYNVKVQKPGLCHITVTATGQGGKTYTFKEEFKAKPIPDPTPILAGRNGGKIPAGLLKTQAGPKAQLKGFVFRCEVPDHWLRVAYTLLKTGGGDLRRVINKGGTFNTEAKRLDRREPSKVTDSFLTT